MRFTRTGFEFCLAIAVMAAAIADPLVEFASNAGWFGPGRYTDRCNFDVVPTLVAGVAFLALFMVRRARSILVEDALPRRFTALFPAIFVLQLLTLYVMETVEQILVFGHPFAPTVWLGAPLPMSLAVHGAIGLVTTYAVVRSRRSLAATTLRVIRLIVAVAAFLQTVAPTVAGAFKSVRLKKLVPIFCAIGERAPPIAVR